MRFRLPQYFLFIFIPVLFISTPAFTQNTKISLSLDSLGGVIDANIYGQFSEHLPSFPHILISSSHPLLSPLYFIPPHLFIPPSTFLNISFCAQTFYPFICLCLLNLIPPSLSSLPWVLSSFLHTPFPPYSPSFYALSIYSLLPSLLS